LALAEDEADPVHTREFVDHVQALDAALRAARRDAALAR
jgi:hypothetical protein